MKVIKKKYRDEESFVALTETDSKYHPYATHILLADGSLCWGRYYETIEQATACFNAR